MGGRILTKENFIKEFKASIILIFAIFSLFFVKESYFLPLMAINSFIFLVLNLYMTYSDLRISRGIFLIIICLLNVFTFIFMIQYLLRGEINAKVYEKIFWIFAKDPGQIFYTGWIFVLTTLILILQKLGGGHSG